MPDDTPDPAASALDGIRQLERAATRGPWKAEEGDDHWQLFGAVTVHMHPLQLIKAPKHGTPYAEYWPSEADSAFIAAARADVPRLLKAVEAALKLADDWDAESDHLDDLAERGDGDEEGRPVMAGQAIAYHDAAVDLREAITAALAGTRDTAP